MPDQDHFATSEPQPSTADVGPLTKELSVLDGLYVLARRRRLIILLTLLGIAFGVVVALTTPSEYTSSAVLMRETRSESRSGGSLAALRGLGLNLGESQTGLTIEAYPDVLTSHEVRANLLAETFILESGERTTFLDYVQTRETASLGRSLRRFFGGGGRGSDVQRSDSTADSLSVAYTFEEQEAMESMSRMISVNADADTGLMTVSVTAQDPVLAASLVGRLIGELQTRVQSLLTQKAREDYQFIRERAQEAEGELRTARAQLARFDDRNRGLTSAQLLAERDRLRQDMSFATEVFGQYQSELKQAEIEVQRASPVITVLDRPVVPLLRSRPRRKLIVLVGGLFGMAGGLLFAFLLEGIRTEAGTESGQRKRQAIRDALRPGRARRRRGASVARDGGDDQDLIAEP